MSAQDSTDRKALLRQALRTVEDLQARLDASERAPREPIAVVGLGCRFPGAEDPDALWDLLREGIDAVRDVPRDRWNADLLELADAGERGRAAASLGGYLERVDLFDAGFFGISPREAATLDPQQRLLLEVSWEALENAGQAPDQLKGTRTGVFVGITTSDYAGVVGVGEGRHTDVYAATGNALNAAAGRISFVLGLQGPCMAVDTACSSSLTAIHLACQSLRAGDCHLALAGGVNLILSPEAALLFARWGMLAPDGRCKTFDAAADGFIRSEGCGVLALKTLSRAEADGDRILALLLGSAVNQDGASSGLTVPNGPAQQAVLRRALEVAGVEPGDVDYVEAHGTGTPIGDPIEVEALAASMVRGRSRERPLAIGSIKTNIGHAEAASGIAGVLKVVLSLQHEAIPPHLHMNELNPRFDWGDGLEVPTQLTPWTRGARRRIAGVSSFGFSGTNAHVVVAEAPPPAAPVTDVPERPLQLLTLAARTEEALQEGARRLEARLAAQPPLSLPDVAFTLNTGRATFTRRAAIVARDRDEARDGLAALAGGAEAPGVHRGDVDPGEKPRIAFLFTGQGSQYVGMGRDLYETQPVFRAELDRCAEVARTAGVPLLEIMFGDDGGQLDRTENTQPALFALEWALAQLWRSWGIEPSSLLGHSIGEYVAACVADVVGVEDAMRLVLARGRLMGALPSGGAMVSCLASEERLRDLLAEHAHDGVSVAALNGPESTVISGRREAVEGAAAALERDGVKTKSLVVSHAFHSALLEPILEELEAEAGRLEYRAPRLDVMSNLTGRALSEAEIDAAYWRRHARESVRFLDGMRGLEELGCTLFLEIGPQPVLLGMGQACVGDGHGTWLPSLRKGRTGWEQILESLGRLFCEGAPVDWRGHDRGDRRSKLTLPTYAFQRERHWVEAPRERHREGGSAGSSGDPGHPLLGRHLRSAARGHQFESTPGEGSTAYLHDHVLYGQAVFPGSGYLEMALATVPGDSAAELRDVAMELPLPLTGDGGTFVQCHVDDEGGFEIFSLEGDGTDGWRRHAAGHVASLSEARPATTDLPEVRARCPRALDVESFYEQLSSAGVQYGPTFRPIEGVWAEGDEAVGRLRLSPTTGAGGYRLHPALLDGAFQLLGAVLLERGADGEVFVPTGLGRLRVWGALGDAGWAQVRLSDQHADGFTAEVRLFDDAGAVIVLVEGLAVRKAPRAVLERLRPRPHLDWLYETAWEEKPQVQTPRLPPSRWLVVSESGGVGKELVEALRSREAPVQMIEPGDGEAIAASLSEESTACNVVHVGVPEHGSTDDAFDPAAQRLVLEGALRTVQALARSEVPSRLYLVTSGAHAVGGGAVVALAQRSLWGLGATVATEHPELGCARIDLDPAEGGVDALLQELGAADGEVEVVYRGGTRFVARLERLPRPPSAAPGETAVAVQIAERGSIDALQLASRPRRAPGPGEVEIRVEACGLNFRDVLGVLGMYPGPPLPLGTECAGRVTTVGEGVVDVAVGDEVLAMVGGALATHVTAGAHFVARRPAGLGPEAAVTVPSAFLTAEYALCRLGRMRRGERVLIHAAAGGVGMAAVQLARRAGAEIFATAGSPEKRAFLESIGVSHVMGSRDLSFVDEVQRRTGGEGVDLVLNALSGEFIPAGLGLLRQGGRFLEIGKRGVWDQEKVAAEYPGVEYHVLDLGEVAEREPALVREMLDSTLAAIEEGDLAPLPTTGFWLSDAPAAFRFMAQAKHIGKIVLKTGMLGGLEIRPDATYLLTGGLGGLGLVIARWLAEQGARHLVLAARGAPGEAARAALEEIERLGAAVEVRRADVSQGGEVRALVDGLSGLPPLRGVVHAAGVVEDAALPNQTWERFDAVLGPKAGGAWALHQATLDTDLDFFVLFSSASAVLGAPGQANYTSANALLDGLAHWRRARALPALSVNWGPWADVGMAARLDARERARQAGLGLGTIPPRQGAEALGDLLAREATQALVLPVEWSAFLAAFPAGAVPARYESMAGEVTRPGAGAGERPSEPGRGEAGGELKRVLDAAPVGEHRGLVEEHVRAQVARVLGLKSEQRLGLKDGLTDLGMDSLMAVELRNRLQASLLVTLPTTVAYEHPTLGRLAEHVLQKVTGPEPPGENPPPEENRPDQAELEGLSREELEARLNEELERGGF